MLDAIVSFLFGKALTNRLDVSFIETHLPLFWYMSMPWYVLG